MSERGGSAVPLTRDLRETVRALEVAEAEFLFQAERLGRTVTAETENEAGHLSDLRNQYEAAAKAARILTRYHKGRLGIHSRPEGAASQGAQLPGGGIDARGIATAHVDDADDASGVR